MPFGTKDDRPVAGDWNGDGIDDRRRTTGRTRASSTSATRWHPGEPEVAVVFGAKDDLPLAGDWDGDGTWSVGVYRRRGLDVRPAQRAHAGTARRHASRSARRATSRSSGDWDGNGTTTIGVFRPAEGRVPPAQHEHRRRARDHGQDGQGGRRPRRRRLGRQRHGHAGCVPPLRQRRSGCARTTRKPPKSSKAAFGVETDLPVVGNWDGK